MLYADIRYIWLSYDTVGAYANILCCTNCCFFLPVTILRVPQKKKSSSLEDLQSESLEKVGLFTVKISGVIMTER